MASCFSSFSRPYFTARRILALLFRFTGTWGKQTFTTIFVHGRTLQSGQNGFCVLYFFFHDTATDVFIGPFASIGRTVTDTLSCWVDETTTDLHTFWIQPPLLLFFPPLSIRPSVRPLAVRPNSNWQMIRIRMRRVATLAVYYHQTSLAPFSPSTTMAQQPSSIFFPFCCWTGINLSARKYVDVSRLVGGRDKRTLLLLPNRNWGTKRKRKIRRIELWKVTVGPAKRRIV